MVDRFRGAEDLTGRFLFWGFEGASESSETTKSAISSGDYQYMDRSNQRGAPTVIVILLLPITSCLISILVVILGDGRTGPALPRSSRVQGRKNVLVFIG